MNENELYLHLSSKGIIGPKKVRVHVQKVARVISSLIQGDQDHCLNLATLMLQRSKQEYWLGCLDLEISARETLADKLEDLLDKHYQGQSTDLWQDIKIIIKAFNNRNPRAKLPVDKKNIAVSLLGKESMTIMEFVATLGLLPKHIRHSSGESASTIHVIWQDALFQILDFEGVERSLGDKIVELIYAGGSRLEWQRRILQTLEYFYKKSNINLGYTSWTTLSRGIKGIKGAYISQEDFRVFIMDIRKKKNTLK